MYMRLFVAFMITAAVVIGLLACFVLKREQLIALIGFRDFFDITLPILAFTALIKYLCSFTTKK